METFYQVFGFVGAICAGIIILAGFFTALNYFKTTVQGPDVLTVKGFVREGKLVNVHLAPGRTLEKVRFIGFTSHGSVKGGGPVPYQLSSMAVLESSQGNRVLVRAESIRSIEEIDVAL
jgi:hypothetical protein